MAPKTKESKETRKSNNGMGKMSKGLGRKKGSKAVSGSSKAGLIFPVGRMGRYLKQGRYSERFGKGASIFMAAVLEYITCEILELAGNAAEENKRSTIAPRHLQLAVRNDEELAKLMSQVMISSGGYMSNIHPFLFKGKGTGKVADTQEM